VVSPDVAEGFESLVGVTLVQRRYEPAALDVTRVGVATAAAAERVTTIVPMINGMAQIEIFKMFREIEADRYDKDTIVREAYKILRILKSINMTSLTVESCRSSRTLK
jgi:hypothetical protein